MIVACFCGAVVTGPVVRICPNCLERVPLGDDVPDTTPADRESYLETLVAATRERMRADAECQAAEGRRDTALLVESEARQALRQYDNAQLLALLEKGRDQ